MTKDNDVIYLDRDTYYQMLGRIDEESYIKFLKRNPNFIDPSKKTFFSVDKNMEVIEEAKKKKIEEMHQKDEDYKYMPYSVWLEMYLPRYEIDFGKFTYSKKELTYKKMCTELLNYYENVCGITDVKDIFKKSTVRGKIH